MNNHRAGSCWRCLQAVAVGDGHYVRRDSRWRLMHHKCATAEDEELVQERYRKPVKTKENPD